MSDDLFDKVLRFLGAFDWIGPTVAFTQDFAKGPSVIFGVSSDSGWGAKDIRKVLEGQGVDVWGFMLTTSGDTLMFTVRKKQEGYAQHILKQAGVPIL